MLTKQQEDEHEILPTFTQNSWWSLLKDPTVGLCRKGQFRAEKTNYQKRKKKITTTPPPLLLGRCLGVNP